LCGLDYHSFRAGVTTKLATAGVPLEVCNELLGHEGKTVDEQAYLKGFPALRPCRCDQFDFLARGSTLMRQTSSANLPKEGAIRALVQCGIEFSIL
jgi:hypothetical protein